MKNNSQGKTDIWIIVISLIFPTLLTLAEIILNRTNDLFAWILVGVTWFITIALLLIRYVKGQLDDLQIVKTKISSLQIEIDLNNKILKCYEMLLKVKK